MVSILLPFVNRTLIIWLLGVEFAGMSSLFASVLEVLNLANLGFNTAIVYSLYKPMAEQDTEQICELITLFRKIYHIVGLVILGAGLVILPFITCLIHGTYPESVNIYVIYLLYLINSVVSYFLFAYKEVLLIADQRRDVSDTIRTIVNALRYCVQFVFLLAFRDYYIYLVLSIAGTVLTNLFIQHSTVRRYPEYRFRRGLRIAIPDGIRKQTGGLLINRICDTFRNSFDSLILSSFFGLAVTAIYGNYYYIYSSLYGIMLVICNAMSASVGNSIVRESVHKNYEQMLHFEFLFAWISGWCTCCLLCLYQPFMMLWVGGDLLLPDISMILFCVYFYAINMNNIRNQYISGTGMWWKLKISYIIEAFGNLILNFLLGKLWGINGVLIATIITIVLFNFFWRSKILFSNYFKQESFVRFLVEHVEYIVSTIVMCILSYFACNRITGVGLSAFLLRIVVCVTVPNVIILLLYGWTKRFRWAEKFAGNVIGTFRKRNGTSGTKKL